MHQVTIINKIFSCNQTGGGSPSGLKKTLLSWVNLFIPNVFRNAFLQAIHPKKNAMPCLPWCNECEFPFFSFSPQKTRPLKRPWNSDSSHENSHRQMPPWKAARKGEKKVVGQTLQVLEPCAKKEEWWWREGVKGYLCHGLWNNPHKTGLITLLLLSLTFFW